MSNLLASAAQDQSTVLAQLPLEKLFGAPFEAAYSSQMALSEKTIDFLRTYALDASSSDLYTFTTSSFRDIPAAELVDASGNQAFYVYKVGSTYTVDPPGVGLNIAGTGVKATDISTIEINGQKLYVDKSGRIVVGQTSRSITLPFISLLNVPSLVITEVEVDFKITIKTMQAASTVNTNTQNINFGVGARYSGNAWGARFNAGFSVNVQATLTNNSTQFDETKTDSTYQVKIIGRTKEPLGMKLLMDFISGNAADSTPQYARSADGYSVTPAGPGTGA
jgi:hypothetical protein